MRDPPFIVIRPVFARFFFLDLPVMAVQRKQSAHIHAEPLQNIFIRCGKLLDRVA